MAEKDTLVGFISEQQVYLQFMVSMLNIVGHPRTTRIAFVEGGPQIHQHRNGLNHAWMLGPEPYLLVVDTDVVFSPDMLDTLHATLEQYPEAGGVSALLMSTISYGIGGGFNLLGGTWDGLPGEVATWSSLDHVPTEPFEDAVAGAGFMLLRKEFVEPLGDYPYDPIPFEKEGEFKMTNPSRVMAEDIAFYHRIRASGHPIMLEPSVLPMHLKTMALRPNATMKSKGVLSEEDTRQKIWTPGADNPTPVIPINRAARRRAKRG